MVFKVRQYLGKYRIERKVAEGGFAVVYKAFDTIEGIRVALKVPHSNLVDDILDDFRKEVRLAARLDHSNILPLKFAGYIDGHFVIVFSLGERTLADRLQNRMAMRTTLDLAEQMLEGAAYAHRQRIVHCDIKPENLILFSGNRLRLTDFGIAKVALRTLHASGSGTLGYMAPEQAMGRPSPRSDVFSLGLVLYRMLAGHLPEWPFDWPPRGYANLKGRVNAELISVLRRSMHVDPRKRFQDANQMLTAFQKAQKAKPKADRILKGSRPRATTTKARDWQTVRRRQFQRQYGQILETRHCCDRCDGPVSEHMQACPWCGKPRNAHKDGTRFPIQCPRCERGLKLDWSYCPWCYGAGFVPDSRREYSDVRYDARCSNARCSRKLLMPFMRYCPWCRSKVRKKWKIPGSQETCPSCSWGVLRTFWSWCPWCRKSLSRR